MLARANAAGTGRRWRNDTTVGALATMAFAIAGIVWFAFELAPPLLGFQDTDDPAVSLDFIRAHTLILIETGVVLLAKAVALTIAAFAVSDLLAPRASALAIRSITTIGLFAAAFFFMHGVLRFAAEPLLYIDGLDRGWGESAYLVILMLGIHGFAQGGIFALCVWAVAISVIGWRTRTLPLALCLLGVLPAIRLFSGLVGPFGVLPDGFWLLSLASIFGVMFWSLALGVVLLRRAVSGVAPLA